MTRAPERGAVGPGGIRSAAVLVGLALGIRLLLLGATVVAAQVDAGALAGWHDGGEYQAYAAALGPPLRLAELPEVTQRLFPGYPLAVGAVAWLLPPAWAALLVSLLAAAVAAPLMARASGDVWSGAYLAVFPPSWLLFSSLAMSEGLFLATALAGLLLWRAGRPWAAGAVLGFATLVRPVGAMILAACAVAWLLRRHGRRVAAMVSTWAAFPLGWAAACWAVWGDPLRTLHAYADKDWAPPLVALGTDLVTVAHGWPRTLLTVAMLAAAAGAIPILVRRARRGGDPVVAAWAAWAGLGLAFHVLLPSSWTLAVMDRFLVTCVPPALVAYSRWLPRRPWAVAAAAAGSLAVALSWTLHKAAEGMTG